MKNTFGTNVSVTLFGESHGEAIGAVIDGLSPGIPVDQDAISAALSLRRGANDLSTARREADPFSILSGVFDGKTTGTPIALVIPNGDTKSGDYAKTRALARPGHADYTAYCKYHGFEDHRGGGHFSGRLTAPIVAVGAICRAALATRGITLATHIARCAGIADEPLAATPEALRAVEEKSFAVVSDEAGEKMKEAIRQAAADGDSVGGVCETVVCGLPAGLGEPWFDSVEGVLSHLLFSIPAVKGVEFGDGFALAEMRGSAANDPFRMQGDTPATVTNRNGGINGGITNGMPLVFRTAVKPTPSIYKTQDTVDFFKGENASLSLSGRHDPAIVHRARIVVSSVTAILLCDLLEGRFGTDYFTPEK